MVDYLSELLEGTSQNGPNIKATPPAPYATSHDEPQPRYPPPVLPRHTWIRQSQGAQCMKMSANSPSLIVKHGEVNLVNPLDKCRANLAGTHSETTASLPRGST